MHNDKPSYIEAYQEVCRQADPYKTYTLLNELERTGLAIDDSHFKGIISPAYYDGARAYIQQVMLRSQRKKANPKIMQFYAGQKISYSIPYPRKWRDILSLNGLKICTIASRAAFFYAQLRQWGKAALTLKYLLKTALNSYDINHFTGNMIYNVPHGTLPRKNRVFQKNTFIDWLRQEKKIEGPYIVRAKKDAHQNIDESLYIAEYIFPRMNKREIFDFLKNVFFLTCRVFFKWLSGKWAAPYLLPALIEDLYFNALKQKPSAYIFCNSDFAIRPFWTYRAQEENAKITLCFYSANINCFYAGQVTDAPPPPGYISMSWPEYWVIDDTQAHFLSQNCRIASAIQVVGPIDFTDSEEELPPIPKNAVALFDISVFDLNHVAPLALIAPYYTPDIMASFLMDVVDEVTKQGGYIVWKMKRDVRADLVEGEYQKVINQLRTHPNVICVPSGIAAKRVLENVTASISIPFTSTALTSDALGCATAYYDPTATLTYEKDLSRDLPVLRGREALEKWVSTVLGPLQNDVV